MAQFLTLLKLEFLSKINRAEKGSKVFPRVLKWLLIIAGAALIGYVIVYGIGVLVDICLKYQIQEQFLVFFILLLQLVQFLFGTSLTTKTLFFSNDSDKLKLAVSGTKIFLAKITYLFISELIFTLILSLPVFITYGIRTSQMAGFYFKILPIAVLLPIIPFLISLLLSVPMMYVVGFLKNKFIIMLILYVACVAIGFYLYIIALQFIMSVIQSSSWTVLENADMVLKIKNASNIFIFPALLKNMLVGYKFFQSLVITITSCIVLFLVILFFFNKVYFFILYNNIESESNFFEKSTVVKDRSISSSLFFREFMTIFRSPNYSFQYLTMVITTPLMVYFCNLIASNIAAATLGNTILPGISILVLLMFLSMGTSFAATSITREGDNFYHTKVIPVSFTKQIVVKYLLYVIVAIPSIFVSCFVLILAKFLTFVEAIVICFTVALLILGNIAKAINIDIKKPKFMFLNGKEVTGVNQNVNTSLGIGFFIATIVGVASIVVAYLVSLPILYSVLIGFSVSYFTIEILRLFIGIERKYRNIEV